MHNTLLTKPFVELSKVTMAWRGSWLLSSLLAVVLACGANSSGPLGAHDAGTDGASGDAGSLVVVETVGPDGGVVTLGGLTLTIPRGALSTNQTITVTLTVDPIPADYVGYSPMYRFEPSGLTFARSALVSMPFTGAGSNATLFWSQLTGPGYDALTGNVAGDFVVASVSHFSTGFVGFEPLGPDGSAHNSGDAHSGDVAEQETDSSGVADAREDLPTADASMDGATVSDASGEEAAADASTGDANYCANAPVEWSPNVLPETDQGLPAGNCNSNQLTSISYFGMELAIPTQVTVYDRVTPLGPGTSGGAFLLDAPCNVAQSMTCIMNYAPLATMLFQPGLYYLGLVGDPALAGIVFETPPAVAANTSCQSALLISNGNSYTEPRITDGLPRVYTFTLADGGVAEARFIGPPSCGGANVTAQLQQTCGGPAIQSGTFGCDGSTVLGNEVTAPGTYFIYVTADPGATYTLQPFP